MELVLEVLVGVLSYAVVLAVVIVGRRRRMSGARPPHPASGEAARRGAAVNGENPPTGTDAHS